MFTSHPAGAQILQPTSSRLIPLFGVSLVPSGHRPPLGLPPPKAAPGDKTTAHPSATITAKAIYRYIPEIVEFYTGGSPILKNVPTYDCRRADDLAFVVERLHELVVKEVHGSGGHGMLVGPAATSEEIERFRQKLVADPGARGRQL